MSEDAQDPQKMLVKAQELLQELEPISISFGGGGSVINIAERIHHTIVELFQSAPMVHIETLDNGQSPKYSIVARDLCEVVDVLNTSIAKAKYLLAKEAAEALLKQSTIPESPIDPTKPNDPSLEGVNGSTQPETPKTGIPTDLLNNASPDSIDSGTPASPKSSEKSSNKKGK